MEILYSDSLVLTSLSFDIAGIPMYYSELESMADRGLGAVVAQINSVYAVSHLYRVTRGYVKKVSLHALFFSL